MSLSQKDHLATGNDTARKETAEVHPAAQGASTVVTAIPEEGVMAWLENPIDQCAHAPALCIVDVQPDPLRAGTGQVEIDVRRGVEGIGNVGKQLRDHG